MGSFRKTSRHIYDRSKLVFFKWKDSDQVFEDETKKITACFEDLGWETERCSIKDGSASQLLKIITTFDVSIEDSGKRGLLLLYYSGHGFILPGTTQAIPSRDQEGSATMSWGTVQSYLLDHIKLDVIVVLDACNMDFAGWYESWEVGWGDKGLKSGRNLEIWVTAGKNSDAPLTGRYSFAWHFLREAEWTIENGPNSAKQAFNNIRMDPKIHVYPHRFTVFKSDKGRICLEAYPTQVSTAVVTVYLRSLKWVNKEEMESKYESFLQWIEECPLSTTSTSHDVSGFGKTNDVNPETSQQSSPAPGKAPVGEERSQKPEASALHHNHLPEPTAVPTSDRVPVSAHSDTNTITEDYPLHWPPVIDSTMLDPKLAAASQTQSRISEDVYIVSTSKGSETSRPVSGQEFTIPSQIDADSASEANGPEPSQHGPVVTRADSAVASQLYAHINSEPLGPSTRTVELDTDERPVAEVEKVTKRSKWRVFVRKC